MSNVVAALARFVRTLPRVAGVPLGYLFAHALRWSPRRVGLAIVYHSVGDPQGDPGRDLVPAYGTRLFEAQVRHLRSCYRVVPASQLLPATVARRRGERIPVAITFDDDLPSHARLAMPILRRLGATATFFLSGASLAEPHRFWWERLQAAVDRGLGQGLVPASEPAGIHGIAATIERLPTAERDGLAEELRSRLGPDPSDAGMRAHDVRALAEAGFEIGFHTLRHDALVWLGEDELESALTEGRERVAALAGRELTTIGYPHGKADARVAAAARAAGYEFGFTTYGGAIRPETEPLLIGRFEPSFESAGRFALQVLRTLI